MAFQSVPETAQIDVNYTLNDVPVQNSFYGRLPGGYNLADLQALADAVDGVVGVSWLTEQASEATYVISIVRGLEFENDQVAQQNANTGSGSHGGQALPNQVTFAIKKTSGLTGRSARGRTFWIGVPETELQAANENLVVATYAAAVVVKINEIRLIIDSVGAWEAVLVSRFADKVQRPTGVTFAWTGSTNVDLRVDTHRGRLPSV